MDEEAKKAADRLKEDAVDEKLKADLEAATAKIEALTKENGELQKKLDTPEEIEKRKLSALPESVRKQLTDQAEEIRKMRDDKAESEQIENVRKNMPQLPGKAEDNGRLLKRVKDVVKAEDFEAFSTMLKAASAQLGEARKKLFSEIGNSGDGDAADESPKSQIDKLVNGLVEKSKDLALADAYAQVAREHPDLYAAYSRLVTVGASADQN
jgi:hypothetical protein